VCSCKQDKNVLGGKELKSFRHWTPQYVFHRALDLLYRRFHPDDPWLTPQAISILDSWLTAEDKGIEWGSGKSTLWFARRVKQLVSIEHDPVWYDQVSVWLKRGGDGNVDYRLLSVKGTDGVFPYADVANSYPDQFFNFALVDGRLRHVCIDKVLPKLRVGGMLILDNSERYVPSDSRGTYFEKGRHLGEFAKEWDAVLAKLSSWRTIGTTNGVWCTRLWIKPCSGDENLNGYSENS